jgi:hypothetical protein
MRDQATIAARLEAWLAQNAVKEKLVSLDQSPLAADATSKFLLWNESGRPTGFLLCSSRASPLFVRRSVDRAAAAREVVGEELSSAIIDPAYTEYVDALSFAVFPYYPALSSNRWILAWQRRRLRGRLLEWLSLANLKTLSRVEQCEIIHDWESPLRRIAQESPFQQSAAHAIDELRAGNWKPRFVLSHGDFWLGNILRAPRRSRWPFVIIDWAGSSVRGYAIYDLIRLAKSVGLSAAALRDEIDIHCAALDCTRAQAGHYLLAALGNIALNLEHFPRDRFTAMAESCWETFTAACAR